MGLNENLSIDIARRGTIHIPAKQDDRGYLIILTIKDNGVNIVDHATDTAKFRLSKADHTVYYGDAVVNNDDTVSVPIDTDGQMLAVPGYATMDVTIFQGTVVKSTQNFILDIQAAPGGSDIPSQSVFIELRELMEEAEIAIPAATAAAEAANDAADAADAAAQAVITMLPKDTASGPIASFPDGADDFPVVDCLSQIIPVQDLHGYDNPWPAGGGKNLFPTAGNGTMNGVTYTTAEDGTVTLNGLCTLSNNIVIATKTLTAGPYSICDFASGTFPNNSSARCQVTTSGFYLTTPNNEASTYIGKSTLASDSSVEFRIRLEGGHNYQNCTLKPMVVAENASAMTYSPYENNCPISGRTGGSVTWTGKNLLNDDFSVYSSATNYLYLLDVVPKLSVARMTLSDKDTSVDVSGCYIGFCSNDVETLTSPSEYRWCVNNGIIGSVLENISIRDVRLGSVFVYPKTQATFNKLFARWNIQVELGVDATAYEPYSGITIPITFPTAAGTVYGGSVDVTRGKLTVTHKYMEYDGTEAWSAGTNYFALFGSTEGSVSNADTTQISNVFVGGGNGYADYNRFRVQTNGAVAVGNKMEDGTVGRWATVNDFQAFLVGLKTAGTPFSICYELATPITYQLSQVEVRTLLGDNNVWSDTGDVSVKYKADIGLYIQKLLANG